MSIVHVGTLIQVHFGDLDEHGNVIPREPLQLQIKELDKDRFVEAFDTIVKARDEAQ